AWEGAKPATGLPTAARGARHALLADAARTAGARVILMGHTRDDVLEAAVMRREGVRLGGLAEWSPSPVLPEGRGGFLFRPLLGVRRAALREILAQDGWTWIEDPANQDLRHPRARARALMAAGHGMPGPEGDAAANSLLAFEWTADKAGGLNVGRATLT